MAFRSRWMLPLLAAAVTVHAPMSDASTKYEGPPVTVTLNKDGGAAKATVKVTFPTGGWEIAADSSSVKEGAGVARLTFTGPGRDDMVAQVVSEKEWTWESAESFERAEVWVRLVRRGESAPDEYQLAAKAP